MARTLARSCQVSNKVLQTGTISQWSNCSRLAFPAIHAVKKKVLIIVENNPVPLDTRVWKEACSLRDSGCELTVLSPRGKAGERRQEIIDGIRVYRHPAPFE